MADSTPLSEIIALSVLAVFVIVILPAGPGSLSIVDNQDYQETWDEYQVDNSSLDFSAGIVLLLFNLGLLLGILSYSLVTYREPDDEEPWRDRSYFEDDE